MATNRKRTPRSRQKPPLNSAEIAWLNSENVPVSIDSLWLRTRKYADRRAFWNDHKGPILKAWIKRNPGTRPERWWRFDAPRWMSEEYVFPPWSGQFPDPRKRLGGIGTPDYEALNICPVFFLGVPSGWISEEEEAYYSGRVIDVLGEVVLKNHNPGDFTGRAIDPACPPLFESQAAYLSRFGLLTPGEKRFLKNHPERMEPETIFHILG